MNQKLKEKTIESLTAVLPITGIVILLCVTITPLPLAPLMLFLAGAALLIIGMGIFTLGVDMAMMPIGEYVGNKIAQSRYLIIIVLGCFLIGTIVTVAEPDLQVLASQTPAVPDLILILSVAMGVGAFLVVAFLRSLFGWQIKNILLICYALLFVLAFFIPKEFLAVAFDSGGVTTGPITVPFIMALGTGLSSIGKGEDNDSNSFGLLALCSIGPIISVMILGTLYSSSAGSYVPFTIPSIETTRELSATFAQKLPVYAKEVFTALLPIVLFFFVFQIFWLKINKRKIIKILVGIVYSFVGLTLFLTGVNVGFMPAGKYIGQELASLPYNWVMIPISMVIGYYIVKAEPAVQVLNKQVEEVTGGAISEHTMMRGLSIGMALSLALSIMRVFYGIPLLAFLLPGYAIALGLSFVVPPIFTSIAFDSGGVASGTMTAAFLLPLAMGACEVTGGNILTDAFGIIAMVAMAPLIIIQMIGLLYQWKTRHVISDEVMVIDEDEIIELVQEA
ncbi:MAG TPA: DUF1538 domain-containing protein [Candidatus Pelethocola excrementipullorum]|nr:DUF1538 domain-containing protein [Candidatus Pelethocola excrementipullorum]